ncbi:MAG: DUF1570 domain-containing protein [Planctomycetes bacterium]|nr:DUF1570 domain-containing protein [Planctomycetota bacterium]
MHHIARMLLAAALVGPVVAQDPPADPPKDEKSARRLEREKKAEQLWQDAQKLMEAGKHAEALESLRMLREKYIDTEVYVAKNQEIRRTWLECGYKVAAVGLQKQGLGTRLHLDTSLGFRFAPPEGWRGIPNWQALFGQTDTSEGNNRGESYRCARYTSRWSELLYLDVYKTYGPAGAEQVLEGAHKIYRRDETDLKEIAAGAGFSHRKYQTVKRAFTDGEGSRKVVYAFYDPSTKKGFGLVGYWKVREDGGIIITLGGTPASSEEKAPQPEDKDWDFAVSVYDQVARSFEIMDQGTLTAERLRRKGSPLNAGGWIVQCADWNQHVTANYIIEYATRKEFAERLGKELETIMALYKKVIPSHKAVERGRVKLFDCEEDFQYYGQAPGAAAYWSPAQREIVAYRYQRRKVKIGEKAADQEMTIAEEKNPEEVTFNIIYHEAFHQYMENIMGISRDVYVPSWLNEGMGDYFFGGRWNKNGKFEIGLNDWRLETIVKAVKENKHVPLAKLFEYTQADYYSNAGLCYAEGWSICYFFLSEEGKKKRYHLIPPRFFDELKKSGDYKRVNAKVLSQVNLDEMEREWKAFVLGLERFLPQKPQDEKSGTKEPPPKSPQKNGRR